LDEKQKTTVCVFVCVLVFSCFFFVCLCGVCVKEWEGDRRRFHQHIAPADPKSVKRLMTTWLSFLHFWALHAQKLRVKRWWSRHLVSRTMEMSIFSITILLFCKSLIKQLFFLFSWAKSNPLGLQLTSHFSFCCSSNFDYTLTRVIAGVFNLFWGSLYNGN